MNVEFQGGGYWTNTSRLPTFKIQVLEYCIMTESIINMYFQKQEVQWVQLFMFLTLRV